MVDEIKRKNLKRKDGLNDIEAVRRKLRRVRKRRDTREGLPPGNCLC